MLLRDFKLTAIEQKHLQLNQPLPWAIYDEFGKLLMHKGAILRSERQIAILINVGFFAKDTTNQAASDLPQPTEFKGKINPFAEFDDLCIKLEKFFTLIEKDNPPSSKNLIKRILDIVTSLQGLVAYDSDALLGAIHLNTSAKYIVLHPLQKAVLTELILRKLKVSQEVRLSTLSAALTANLAMNPYQERLHNQKSPLTSQQREVINRHPIQAKQKLEALGIDDKLWLEIVLQHHEKLDGSGYPNQLKHQEIRREARILALADIYSAMVTSRPYRQNIQHKETMRQLFMQRGGKLDEKLTLLFLSELGIYPPGIFVRLNNRELAVVIGRTPDPKAPLVASIKKPDGNFFLTPRRRNTASLQFAINKASGIEDRININPANLWGISAIKLQTTQADLSSIADLI